MPGSFLTNNFRSRPLRLILGVVMRRAALAVALLIILSPTASAEWQAGFGKCVITPTEPMWMSGYAARTAPAAGTEIDLWTKAIALRDDAGRLHIAVTLDLVGIDREFSQMVCKLITDKHRLPRENLVLFCSHTHCGPVVGRTLHSMYFLDDEQSRRVRDYTEKLPAFILKVVDAAIGDLAPARLSWGVGTTDFAVNRRNNKEGDVPKLREAGQLKGPHDHDVMALAIRNPAGKLRGAVFGYACHATTLDNYKWSGDYPGHAMLELEARHPGCTALFFAGCGADQNPIPRRHPPLAKEYGIKLADAVDAVLAKNQPTIAGRISATQKEIPLPLKSIPSRDDVLKDVTNENKYVASRAKHLLKQIERDGSLPATYPYPVQHWRLGDGPLWLMLGGEVVVDYALRLKKEHGPGPVWVAGYANDVMAYIPSLRVLNEGGYEGGGAMVYYGLPSAWAPQVEELIIAEVNRQTQIAAGRR